MTCFLGDQCSPLAIRNPTIVSSFKGLIKVPPDVACFHFFRTHFSTTWCWHRSAWTRSSQSECDKPPRRLPGDSSRHFRLSRRSLHEADRHSLDSPCPSPMRPRHLDQEAVTRHRLTLPSECVTKCIVAPDSVSRGHVRQFASQDDLSESISPP